MLFGDRIMFPKNTTIGKKIPKKRFYDNIDLKPTIKKKFTNQIESLVFANKFSKATLNIPKTKDVEEVFVFDITLKDNNYLDKIEDVLSIIDKSVPYPILYQFKIGRNLVYKIAYKKRNLNDPNKSIIDVYLTRKILASNIKTFSDEFDKIFSALNMKVLYGKLIELFITKKKETVEESVEEEKNLIYTQKEIDKLQKIMIKEKQADRQYELYDKIKNLKKDINDD